MKRLTLLRHAKATADSPGGDFDRALNDRGRADAARMGRELQQLGLAFDLILASPARRVVETLEGIGEQSSTFDPRIYNARTEQLLDIVRSVHDGITSLLIVGHNPGIGRLAALLAGDDPSGPIDDYPTAALAEFVLPVDRWRAVGDATGRLVRFIKPRDLG